MTEETTMTKGTVMMAMPLAYILLPGRCPIFVWSALELIGKTVKHTSISPFFQIGLLTGKQYDISLSIV